MKEIMTGDTLDSLPIHVEEFEIHTNESDYQIGVCILQKVKPIAFFSRKCNSTQTKYPVTAKELLVIVETLT